MQVLLVVTLAFAGLWFVALRPKAQTGGAPAQPAAQTAPAQPKSAIPGGLGKSVDKARDAKSTGDAGAAERSAQANGAQPKATPAPKPAKPAPPAGARPDAKAAAGPLTPIARALARGRVVVLLFYARGGSDDGLVRGEVAGIARRGGKVHVKAVPVRRLGRYREALQGAQVLQTPSIVILHRGDDPVLLAGYTDRAEIDQITAARLKR